MAFDLADWIASATGSVKLAPVVNNKAITDTNSEVPTDVLFKGLNTTPTRIGFYDGNDWTNYFSSDGYFKVGSDNGSITYDPVLDRTVFTGDIFTDNFVSLKDGTDTTVDGDSAIVYNKIEISENDVFNLDKVFLPVLVRDYRKVVPYSSYIQKNLSYASYTKGKLNGTLSWCQNGGIYNDIKVRYQYSDTIPILERNDTAIDIDGKVYLFAQTITSNVSRDFLNRDRWISITNNYSVSTSSNSAYLTNNTTIYISPINNTNGFSGEIYIYKGVEGTFDLLTQDYKDPLLWERLYDRLMGDGISKSYGAGAYNVTTLGYGTVGYSEHNVGVYGVGGDIGVQCGTTYINGIPLRIANIVTTSYFNTNPPTWKRGTLKGGINSDNSSNLWFCNGVKWNNIVINDANLNVVTKATKYPINLAKANQFSKAKFHLVLSAADDPTFKLWNASNVQRGSTFSLINAGSTNEVNGFVELEVFDGGILVNCVYSYRKNTTWYHETQNYFIPYTDVTQLSFDIVGTATYTTASYCKITNN